ncbi:MAG: hypothetical protein PHE32_03960 [Candidatus Shapirobacteria bacterium]|nr:hypothetical protein [Candidatus Shapirobacteria bacterium]
MSDENQTPKVAPVNTSVAENPNLVVTPAENIVNAPVVQVEPLGLNGTTANLLKLEDMFDCSIEKLSEKIGNRLGDLVKMASCLSTKNVEEICQWIDKYGVQALLNEFKICMEEIQKKKVSAVR